jgi:formyl-CoA transferase
MGGLTFPGHGDLSHKAGYARLLEGGRKPARTSDGWISMLPYTDRHWTAFFKAAGRAELCERFSLADRAQRNANIRQLYAHMAELTPLRTTAQWLVECEALDIPATPIYGLAELPHHPHLRAVGFFEESEHPQEGALLQMRPATRFSATPLSIRRHAPSLGEHTAEVLAELTSRKEHNHAT